jgi:hypothetical protein
MPPAIDETIKKKVIQQWISGCNRDKIAIENNIGTGTVSSIINYYKIGLDNSEFDLVRELAVEARKQRLSLIDLASHFRLYNFFRKSGTSENEIESFIARIHSNELPPEKVIQYLNQLHEISKEESIPLEQVANYIKGKLEEKRKIDEEVKEADRLLQSKNVSIQAINEHIQLNEKLNKHNLSTQDINKLLKLLVNAQGYGFDAKIIVGKLSNIRLLEKKEKQLRSRCEIFIKQAAKYKDILPLTKEIAVLQIGIDELIALKVGINQAARHYNLPFFSAAVRLIEDIKKYNRLDGLKREISALYLQKYTLEICSRQNQSLVNLAKLKSYGITEDRILQLNNFLEDNRYKDTKSNS